MRNSLFRRFLMATAVAALSILMFTATAAASPLAKYSFTTLNDQADPTFNQLLGINDSGVISGYFGSGAPGHPKQGYTLAPPYGQGNYANENYPGSVQTQVTAINNKGDTAGFYTDAKGVNHAYKLNQVSGKFTAIVPPGGNNAIAAGINDNGDVVGFLTASNGNIVGFYVDSAGNTDGFLASKS